MRDAVGVAGMAKPLHSATERSLFGARSAPFQRVFGAFCALSSIGVALCSLLLVKRTAVDVPFWDEWEWTPLIVSLHRGTVTFHDLWQQHNEHRIFFPSLIAIGLDALGGWSQVRECMVSVALAVLGQLIILELLRATFPRAFVYPLLLIDSLLMFSPSQSDNWITGYQLAWFLANTATFGVIWFLSRPNLNAGLLGLGGACAIVAAYSLAFGLNALLAGFLILLFRRDVSRGALRDWSILSVAVVALFLYHYQRPPVGSTFALSLLVQYFFAYLGLPLARWSGLAGSSIVGVLVFGVFAVCAIAISRKSSWNRMEFGNSLPWMALGMYAIATAVMTAIGRLHFGVEQSLTSRYETPAAIFWIATAALCAQAMRTISAPPRLRLVRAMVLIASIAALWSYRRNVLFGLTEIHAVRLARLSEQSTLLLGLAAPNPTLGKLYPNTEMLRYYLHDLRAVADGPASGPLEAPRSSRSEPLMPLGFVSGSGFIDTVAWQLGGARPRVLVGGGNVPRDAHLEVSGWAADPVASMPFPAEGLVAIVDGRSIVKNISVTYGLARPDVARMLGGDCGMHTGYSIDINMADVQPGSHALVLGAVRWDRIGYYGIEKPVNFVVSRND